MAQEKHPKNQTSPADKKAAGEVSVDASSAVPGPETLETSDPEESSAPEDAAQQGSKPEKGEEPGVAPVLTLCQEVVIVVCGTPEALPLLTKAWEEKAAPAVIIPHEVGATAFSELITGLLADDNIPDTFILIPANCFPTRNVTLADLTAYRVRKFHDGSKSLDTGLPMLLEATAVLKALESLNDTDTFTALEFFEKYNPIAHVGEMAEEIGVSFGNTVAYVESSNPCMAKVAEALVRKKFICTTAGGFIPIKERLALLYDGK